MVSSRILPFLVVLASAFPAASAEGDLALAERFVRAMKLDEQSALGLRMAADSLRSNGKINDAQVACIHKIPADEFVPLMTELAITQLTGPEMQEAILFFDSSAGRKYLQMSEVKSAEMAGARIATPMPEFTSKETRAVNQFGTTPLYQKLVKQAIMTRSPTASSRINGKLREFFQRCTREVSPPAAAR